MKINWGTGIVLAFVAFIAFIMYFVVIASTDEKANHDLVTEQYYKEELAYQDEIDAERNAMALPQRVVLNRSAEGLVLTFPASQDYRSITGKVLLYRPSNKRLDFELPLQLSEGSILIPAKRLPEGRWDLKISWEYEGKAYLQKESITYYP